MMNLISLVNEQLSGDVLKQISQQIGADETQTSQAANGILTALIGGLANNASTPSGIQSLTSALDRDHDGSILDDVMGLVTGSVTSANGSSVNGLGILGHILGPKQDQVAQQISQSSGLNLSQIMKLMPIIAPIVMAVIGKMRNSSASSTSQNTNSGSDLFQILMGTVQQAQGGGFGDLLGTVLGGVLGAQQNSQPTTGGGGILGSIFSKLFKR